MVEQSNNSPDCGGMMNYPLTLTFKLLAINTQVSITDSQGRMMLYVKQKAFKLKEDITVFSDDSQTRPLYHIKADRIIDFSARYTFTNTQGQVIGAIKREGMKSLWKSHYDLFDENRVVATVQEENPWIKVADSLLGEIPVLGLFTGYMFHPAYLLTRSEGTGLLRLVKRPSLTERRYEIEGHVSFLNDNEEARALLGLIMIVLLERARG